MTEKGIEHNIACSCNLHCLNSQWFVTKCVPSIDTYLNWRWRNVLLAVQHYLACSYNLCSLLSVCDVIGLFLAQARPTDDYHLPSIAMLFYTHTTAHCTMMERIAVPPSVVNNSVTEDAMYIAIQ